ncbi:hypothetical protein [Caldanaerobius polysaccharolyticus]|uniref:hypothetical protein n=1 Tax=Caldanaerobius polysaccharolyticus TaxID=44256 RepID=UPI000479C26C|nr:hypothetical protein [Caldanaerobius polysaccharolyticus]
MRNTILLNISIVVIAGIILEFTSRNELINDILAMLGLQRIPFMTMPQWIRTIYVGSGIWQGVGWVQ